MHILSSKRTTLALLLSFSLALVGCKNKEDSQKPPKSTQKSNAATLLDGFTGKTAVEEGKKAKAQIRGIVADRDEQLEQID